MLGAYQSAAGAGTPEYNGTFTTVQAYWSAVTAAYAAAGTTVSGAVSALALAAPPGDIQGIGAAGPVSALALAAPAGTPAGSGAATIAGAVAQLTLTAPAGIPAAIGGGGDDAPWHIRRRR
jgi:hypothetical protein